MIEYWIQKSIEMFLDGLWMVNFFHESNECQPKHWMVWDSPKLMQKIETIFSVLFQFIIKNEISFNEVLFNSKQNKRELKSI